MSHILKMADTIACLAKSKEPRTILQLCEVTGSSDMAVRAHVAALVGEGLVEAMRAPRPRQKGGNSPIVYRWAA